MTNPLALLDKVLSEYASPRARRAIHAALMLVAALVTLYFAYEKDWMAALAALAASVYTAANKANTDSAVEPEEFAFHPVAEFDTSPGEPSLIFGDEEDHGDEADYDYGIVYSDTDESSIPNDLPTDTVHGGEGGK